MSLKNPVTPPGIDPGTVRLVVQRLNHYATPGPHAEITMILKYLLIRWSEVSPKKEQLEIMISKVPDVTEIK